MVPCLDEATKAMHLVSLFCYRDCILFHKILNSQYTDSFLFSVVVVIHCCGILATIKGLHSLRRREMHTTCGVSFLQLLSAKSFRLVLKWGFISNFKHYMHLSLLYIVAFCIILLQLTSLLVCSIRQIKKMIHNIRQYQVPLQKYVAMMDLQVHHIWPLHDNTFFMLWCYWPFLCLVQKRDFGFYYVIKWFVLNENDDHILWVV